MAELSDADLVHKALGGEACAFEALVDRHWERLYVLAVHAGLSNAEAEDVVQEAFIQAYRRLAGLRDPARFGAWLYTTAVRIGHEKRAASVAAGPLPERAAERAGCAAGPAASAEAAETHALVRAAVASLPEHYRVAVILRFFNGMSCEQIAEHLGEPVGTVWTHLHRANELLRARLGSLAPAGQGGGR
jgi:RNA polymerase sigma-70 factor (ECF subfamily)